MSKKQKKENKQIVIPITEKEQIKTIVNLSLVRIISGKTKRTYQQELEFITATLQKYIKITYITKVEHKRNLMEQIFGYVNQLKKVESECKGDVYEAGISLAIQELEKHIYKNGRK